MSSEINKVFDEESLWKRKQCLREIRKECMEAMQLNDEKTCFWSEELRIIEDVYEWTDKRLEEMKCLEPNTKPIPLMELRPT